MILWSAELPFVFDQSHMLMIRKRMLLSILDVKPIVDSTMLPMLAESVHESVEHSPQRKKSRLDANLHEVVEQDSQGIALHPHSFTDLSQINEDDGGSKLTQEEKEDNEFASKIINIGINVRKEDEVGIDLRVFDSNTGQLIHPMSFDSLNYIQRQIVIELVKQAVNGRFFSGIRLQASEEHYARSHGFHIQSLRSMINFVLLYTSDSEKYQRYHDNCAPPTSTTAVVPSKTASSSNI
jgi:hypothetical protein